RRRTCITKSVANSSYGCSSEIGRRDQKKRYYQSERTAGRLSLVSRLSSSSSSSSSPSMSDEACAYNLRESTFCGEHLVDRAIVWEARARVELEQGRVRAGQRDSDAPSYGATLSALPTARLLITFLPSRASLPRNEESCEFAWDFEEGLEMENESEEGSGVGLRYSPDIEMSKPSHH
ncbi:hypothetical protein ALC53_07129, partial [Atta colombica]